MLILHVLLFALLLAGLLSSAYYPSIYFMKVFMRTLFKLDCLEECNLAPDACCERSMSVRVIMRSGTELIVV